MRSQWTSTRVYKDFFMIDTLLNFSQNNSQGRWSREVHRGSPCLGYTRKYEWILCSNRRKVILLYWYFQGQRISNWSKTAYGCSFRYCMGSFNRNLYWSWRHGSCFRSSSCWKIEMVYLRFAALTLFCEYCRATISNAYSPSRWTWLRRWVS